jgi:acyl transferase domain-containing protein/MFS family permease/acyl carrier protein
MTGEAIEYSPDDIAIVGLAGRFPGAKNLDQFWQNLCQGVESIAHFSDEELLEVGIDPEQLRDPSYVKAKGALDEIETFDAGFFGFHPREAQITDPQHRLFLECAVEALEHAGYNPDEYTGRIGVFAGAALNTYLLFNLYSNPEILRAMGSFQTLISSDKDFLATRASYKLNLRGPSMTVQTACSTSLVALCQACQSLLSFQSDIALAGGVSITVPKKSGYQYQEGEILSPDGHCRAFDAEAGGTVSGNGVGLVVLKRLQDALDDGDSIYAVVKSFALNNDGSGKVGYTAPSVEGQAEVIAEALAVAEIDPETISYIEAHGTGTRLGDPIEIAALTQVFRAKTDRVGFCAIGSVKTNIGHLDTAAGIAGLIKTVLALKHGQIPPSLHFKTANPALNLESSPFFVNSRLRDWQRGDGPRRAGVSSFGIGGTNAHVILEEAPQLAPSGPGRPWELLTLSAKTRSALDSASANLAAYLKANPTLSLADVAFTLQVGRQDYAQRRVLLCADLPDAIQTLEALPAERVQSAVQEQRDRPVAFLFPGQGAQYVNMGRELYEQEPLFQAAIDECTELLRADLGLDLRTILYPEAGQEAAATEQLTQTQITQPALFAVEYALARLWQSWGVQPQALIGHSVGEYVAATLAGVFTLKDALKLIATRGKLIQSLPGGAMLSVDLSSAEVQPLLGPDLSLAAINGARLTVVSGPSDGIAQLEAALAERSAEYRRLHTSHAFHSAMLDPIVEPFTAQVARAKPQPPQIPFISNVSGSWITEGEATDPRYWGRQLRQAVNFAGGLDTLLAEPEQALLEVGPGRTLSTFARQHPASRQRAILQSLRHPQEQQPDHALLLTTLGKLWLHGAAIDWAGVYAGQQRRRVPLPSYPFERQRFWIEPRRVSLQPQPLPAAVPESPPAADVLVAAEPLRMAIAEPVAAANGESLAAAPTIERGSPTYDPNGSRSNGTTRSAAAEIVTAERGDHGGANGSTGSNGSSGHSEAKLLLPPRTGIEERITVIWQELLGLEQVGVHDNFFELGGHSLVASRLINRVRAEFGVDLPLAALFESPTVAGLAERVAQSRGKAQVTSETAITRARRDGAIPFALNQEWQWRYDPESVNQRRLSAPRILQLRGPLSVIALERALNEVVRRHEILRTTMRIEDGRPVQRILPQLKTALPLVDLSRLGPAKRRAEMQRIAEEEVRWLPSLEQGPILRASLVRLAPTDHVLLLVSHYFMLDGRSVDILHREISILYEAFAAEQPSPLPEPELQFADFTIWQRQWLQGATLERQLDYWRQQLADAPPVLPLPTDRPRPHEPTFNGLRQYPVIVKSLVNDLRALSRQEGVTLYMTLVAAFMTLLHRFAGRDDIIIGTPMTYRRPETAEMIGRFTNSVVLRADLGGNPTFREVLQRVRQVTQEAYANADVPFEMIAAEFHDQRDPRHLPIYQVYFSVVQNMVQTLPPGGASLTQNNMIVERGKTDSDILMVLNEVDGSFSGVLEYNTDLFDAQTMVHLLGQFEALLESVVANPARQVAEIPLPAAAVPGAPNLIERMALRRSKNPIYRLGGDRPQERQERKASEIGWRVFQLIWAGQLVSIIGSGLTGFALGVWSFEQAGGAATALTLISLFGYLPVVLLSPFAGAIVDRWSRRWGMILSDAGSALTTLIMVILLYYNQLEFWHIYVLTGISAIFRAFQFPAYAAATTQLVPRERLGQANGLVQLSQGVGQLIAPVLAGFLVGVVGVNGVISIDLLTFLFAVLTLMSVRIPRPPQSAEGAASRGTLLQETAFGWRYIRQRPGLLGLMLFFAASNFLMGTVVVLSTPLVLSFATPEVLGTVLSVAGLGILAGSLLLSIWGGPQRKVYGVLGGMLLSSLSMILVGVLPSSWVVGVAAFFFTFGIPAVAASSQVIWQRKVPADIQGRVFGIRAAVATAAMPLAFGISGPLADYVFQPLLSGPLAGTLGQIIGVGPGRGIGLMFMILGLLGILSVVAGYRYERLRFVEDELPDAPVFVPPAPQASAAPATPLVPGDGVALSDAAQM